MGLFESLKEQFFASDGEGQQQYTSGDGSSQGGGSGSLKWVSGRSVFILVAIVLVILIAVTSITVVDQTEESVVLRFGRYHRTLSPGLNFKLPFGLEQSFNVPTQIVQNMTFGFRTQRAAIVSQRARGDFSSESTMLTGDLNIASVEWVIQYRISNPQNWLFNVDLKDKTIRDISISVINEQVGDFYITDVLGNARTKIEEAALVKLNNIFSDYELGINVIAVQLQNIVPPEGSVQDAFEDVNKAIQDMNRLINEGREEYNKAIPKARGEAERLIQEAQGYAAERTNKAVGDAARFSSVLTEYRLSPEVTRERLYFETVEEILNKQENGSSTRFIDSTFNNLVPLLQLDSTQTISPNN